ncbi:class I lanthipeptide [Chitinophaga qingshengii]|uniref:Class I lanthipeptide n=1 Tax=Chitinophaga qingshengii TaxID=1569794 RepID=A0ABR7TQV8_9BACT|nr:class I lanthipeptide [Chitinophaga qingshengii]MBC9932855.1 class I lanthipeptide [Chitinophaga qingshengii]
MKKKILKAEKKLYFGKSAIAVLSASQQEILAGGLPPVTLDRKCYTRDQTCETIPYTQMNCIYC